MEYSIACKGCAFHSIQALFIKHPLWTEGYSWHGRNKKSEMIWPWLSSILWSNKKFRPRAQKYNSKEKRINLYDRTCIQSSFLSHRRCRHLLGSLIPLPELQELSTRPRPGQAMLPVSMDTGVDGRVGVSGDGGGYLPKASRLEKVSEFPWEWWDKAIYFLCIGDKECVT